MRRRTRDGNLVCILCHQWRCRLAEPGFRMTPGVEIIQGIEAISEVPQTRPE